MPGPIEPVGQVRREQLRALSGAGWWRVAIVLAPIVVGTVAAVAIPGPNPVVVFALAAAVTSGVGMVATYVLADSRAKSAFLEAWAQSRGWAKDTGMWLDEATPLLRDGDRRKSKDHVSGTLGGESRAVLCHYTYEVKQRMSTRRATPPPAGSPTSSQSSRPASPRGYSPASRCTRAASATTGCSTGSTRR